MALINCPECGKEISDKAAMCIHCGCPIASHQPAKNENRFSFKPSFLTNLKARLIVQNKKRCLLAVVSLVVLVAIAATAVIKTDKAKKEKAYQEQLEAERQAYIALIEESKGNIAPYLEYIGQRIEKGENIKLSSELYENMDNVEFMGLRGEISYGKEKNGNKIKYCSWSSFDGFSEEEFQAFSNELKNYFGYEAKIDSRDYTKGHTYRYYWVDPDNGLCVSFGHDLFMYMPEGSIEIMWAYEYCEGAEFYGL